MSQKRRRPAKTGRLVHVSAAELAALVRSPLDGDTRTNDAEDVSRAHPGVHWVIIVGRGLSPRVLTQISVKSFEPESDSIRQIVLDAGAHDPTDPRDVAR